MDALDRLERQLCVAVVMARPQVPHAGRLLWQAFIDLHNARSVNMADAQAISHGAIRDYAATERLPFRSEHVRIIRAMDDAWLRKARGTSSGTVPTDAAPETNPALFDAMFGA